MEWYNSYHLKHAFLLSTQLINVIKSLTLSGVIFTKNFPPLYFCHVKFHGNIATAKKIDFPADLVTFTKEILNEELHFLCSV